MTRETINLIIKVILLAVALIGGITGTCVCCLGEENIFTTLQELSAVEGVDIGVDETGVIRDRIKERILIRKAPDGFAEVIFDGKLIALFAAIVWLIKIMCYTMMAVVIGFVVLIFICVVWVFLRAGNSLLSVFKKEKSDE